MLKNNGKSPRKWSSGKTWIFLCDKWKIRNKRLNKNTSSCYCWNIFDKYVQKVLFYFIRRVAVRIGRPVLVVDPGPMLNMLVVGCCGAALNWKADWVGAIPGLGALNVNGAVGAAGAVDGPPKLNGFDASGWLFVAPNANDEPTQRKVVTILLIFCIVQSYAMKKNPKCQFNLKKIQRKMYIAN